MNDRFKRGLLFAAVGLAAIFGYRVWKHSQMEKTVATIRTITPLNSTCGSRSMRHDCTRFQGELEFRSSDGMIHVATAIVGELRGRDAAPTAVIPQAGAKIPIYYDRANPADVDVEVARPFSWLEIGFVALMIAVWWVRSREKNAQS